VLPGTSAHCPPDRSTYSGAAVYVPIITPVLVSTDIGSVAAPDL